LFIKTPLKAQNDYIFLKFRGAMAPLLPPGYAYDVMSRIPRILLSCRLYLIELWKGTAAEGLVDSSRGWLTRPPRSFANPM